ncbi:MAG: hypothetical protein IJM77_03220 [Spirochaetia bacterium]|nr:hypothetical protein [Spirochaetia bacterium]MBQ3647690.1 hypothetical protein [Spirochaetia bacterium]MBQ3713760.1 hypothetical protein [Spirochaetia bacterium]MBQ6673616.1 hypothetical protein [Spirochaetia bacterium]MBR0317721.1 hypothetical protein [Spirochaetia bacterium]
MRKTLALLLILLLSLPAGLFGADSSSSSSKDSELDNVYPDLLPEPYDPDEYPSWTKKTRRFVVVFVGSYPLSVFFTKLGMDFYDWGYHDFSSEYSPSILGGGGDKSRKMTTKEIKKVTLAALAVSGVVAVADFVIQEIKENKRAKAAEKKWKKSNSK